MDLVRSLGADHVIDYTRDDFADGRQRYDVILDIGGNSSLSRLRLALTPRGTLVIVGGEGGDRWLGGVDRQLRALLLSPFVGQKLGTFISTDLTVLKELVEAGKVTPVIDRTYPLSEAPNAIRAETRARQAAGSAGLVAPPCEPGGPDRAAHRRAVARRAARNRPPRSAGLRLQPPQAGTA